MGTSRETVHIGRTNKSADMQRRRVGFVRWHQVVWRRGRWPERALLLMFDATIAFLSGVAVWIFADLLSSVRSGMYAPGTFEFYVIIGLAASNYGAFHNTFSVAVQDRDVWSELLRLGHFSRHEEPLATAYLQLFKAHGSVGRIHGAVRWAVAFWALYYGLFGAAVLFAFTFLPILGPWTPVAFLGLNAPIVVGAHLLYRKKMPFLYEDLIPAT